MAKAYIEYLDMDDGHVVCTVDWDYSNATLVSAGTFWFGPGTFRAPGLISDQLFATPGTVSFTPTFVTVA